jgi:hypothetical protein
MKTASTATRVSDATASSANSVLRQQMQARVDRIREGDWTKARLRELRREWDFERAIEAEAPAVILSGVLLSIFLDRRFAGLSAFAASALLLHNVHGWYPLLPMLRRLGLRTAREIADEAFDLKLSRGDFGDLPEDPAGRARAAYLAAAMN